MKRGGLLLRNFWQFPIIGLAGSPPPPPQKVAIEFHLYYIIFCAIELHLYSSSTQPNIVVHAT